MNAEQVAAVGRVARQMAAARQAAAEGVRISGEKVTAAMVEAGQAVHGYLFTEEAVVQIYLAMRGAAAQSLPKTE